MFTDERIKLAMVNAVSKSLELRELNPNADPEDIMQEVMVKLRIPEKIKIAAMAAVGKALDYAERTKLTNQQILHRVTNELDDIISQLE
ncbi:MAG: hypothetical protein ABH817_02435 [archaeon]